MSKFTAAVFGAAIIGLGTMGSVGAAMAAPSGVSNAQDTVNELQADGYAVQLNGNVSGPLSLCSVTGVHGLPNEPALSGQPVRLTTVYVDLDCMSNN
jgi:hypothetical protein